MAAQRLPVTTSAWIREPLVHFFILGTCLFLAQGWVAHEPRTLEVTPGLRAELARRYQDAHGRAPSDAERATELNKWRRDEALYREALRRGLDRDDEVFRSLLIAKMRTSAGLEIAEPAPTDEKLQAWLESNRKRYETPVRHAFEFLDFAMPDKAASAERERCLAELLRGKAPSSLGRVVTSATLSESDMQGRIPPELIAAIVRVKANEWQSVEARGTQYLVRVPSRTGGMPAFETVRADLARDWAEAERQRLVEQAMDRVVEQYSLEIRP
jgi:hypothetical protein